MRLPADRANAETARSTRKAKREEAKEEREKRSGRHPGRGQPAIEVVGYRTRAVSFLLVERESAQARPLIATALTASLETHVEFRSDRFPPVEGEDEEVSPGRHGKLLAQFIQRGLNERGIPTDEPIAEDWGWSVPVKNDQFRLWVGCGNYDEYPDGLLCFIEPQKPFVRKWFRKSIRHSASQRCVQHLMTC